MTQPWVNPLDRVPQIPQDWANHISQGGLWSIALIAGELLVRQSWAADAVHQAVLHAFLVMTVVSVGKKVVDYFKEFETVQMCVGKAVVSVLWPGSLLGLCELVGA